MKDVETLVAQIRTAYNELASVGKERELNHKIAERQRKWENSEALYLSAQLENEAYEDIYADEYFD